MSRDKEIPQAFPYSGVGDEMNYSKGMTMRDYFASQAINIAGRDLRPDEFIFDRVATRAYLIADAMMKKRAK